MCTRAISHGREFVRVCWTSLAGLVPIYPFGGLTRATHPPLPFCHKIDDTRGLRGRQATCQRYCVQNLLLEKLAELALRFNKRCRRVRVWCTSFCTKRPARRPAQQALNVRNHHPSHDVAGTNCQKDKFFRQSRRQADFIRDNLGGERKGEGRGRRGGTLWDIVFLRTASCGVEYQKRTPDSPVQVPTRPICSPPTFDLRGAATAAMERAGR